MKYTLYTEEGCKRCQPVMASLRAQGIDLEVLTSETLLTLPAMRRADLWAKITMRERDDLPVLFCNDQVIEVETLGLDLNIVVPAVD